MAFLVEKDIPSIQLLLVMDYVVTSFGLEKKLVYCMTSRTDMVSPQHEVPGVEQT